LGKENFSLEDFSRSYCLILSTAARFLSFSISEEFIDEISGQKKMLIPDGRSGVNQRKSQFHKHVVNDEVG